MSEAAIQLDDFGQDLRDLGDRLLESKRVEYVDEGVLLIMWQRYQVLADGAYGEDVLLPAPLGFTVPTADWPRWLP